MDRIGIAITTTPTRRIKPELFTLASGCMLYAINNDTAGLGVSRSRNAAIKQLYDAGCEYIFLFDDDCYPVREGWADYIIEAHRVTGIHRFYLTHEEKSQLLGRNWWLDKNGHKRDIYWWNSGTGCFSFFTRTLIETVGYYNTAYNRYGYEDVAYHSRVWRSGLMSRSYNWGEGLRKEGWPSLPGLNDYILSEDIRGMNPTPNIPMDRKLEYIRQNEAIFLQEINGDQLYYPHE